jgi:hypothetical protein
MQLFKINNPPSLGESLGQGFVQGIDRLLQGKLDEINKRKKIDLYQRSGFTPQAAELLTHLEGVDPKGLKSLISSLGQNAYQQQGIQQMGQEGEMQQSQPQSLFVQKGGASGQPSFEDKEVLKRQIAGREKFKETQRKKSFAYNKVKKYAQKGLDILENKSEELPGEFSKYIGTHELFNKQNPTYRDLKVIYNNIVAEDTMKALAESGSRAGKSFAELSKERKAAVDMPLETQKMLLRGIIDEAEEVDRENNFLSKVRKSYGGKEPNNLVDLFEEWKMSESNPQEYAQEKQNFSPQRSNQRVFESDEIPDASQLPNGTKMTNPEDGRKYVVQNGQWVPFRGV